METPLVLPSPAKLNLFLYVNGRRDDGYHEIQTLFQLLDFCDYVHLSPLQKSSDIILENPLPLLAKEDNLLYRAAKILQDYTACTKGVSIFIEKNIPLGGGLGGGSSNAATVLLALNYLWDLHLPLKTLATLGRALGADVPVFVYGHSAFGEGVGDIVQKVRLDERYYVIAKPDITIATKAIFSDPQLPRNAPKRSLDTLLSMPFTNDLEERVISNYKKVGQLIDCLLKYAPSRVTGTGACVFAECNDSDSASMILNKISQYGCFAVIAKGQNVSSLHQKLNFHQQHQATKQ